MSSSRMEADSTSPDRGEYAITLGIQSRLDQIRLVRAAFAGVLGHLEVVELDIHLLGLAVAEILNNRIEHGYQGDENKQIEVRLCVRRSEVQVDIIDHAPPFPEEEQYRLAGDPAGSEDPNEEWPMRGHGLQIVSKIVDSMTFLSEDGHNCITLRKTVGVAGDSVAIRL